MKELLGGIIGMNKGIGIDDIRYEISTGCNGVVDATQKGNNYVIETVGNKLSSLPYQIVNGLSCVIEEKIDSKLDDKMGECMRMFETRMLEIMNMNYGNNMNCGDVYKWNDYEDISKMTNIKGINGTKLKYHFVNLGLMTKSDGNKTNFYLISENIDDYPNYITDNCKIDRKENRKGKCELFFKHGFTQYIFDHMKEIKDAERIYESNKSNLIKDEFISDIETRLMDATKMAAEARSLLENDMHNIVKDILENDGKAWMDCYITLGKQNKFHFMREYDAYNELCKKQKHLNHDVSRLNFVMFKKCMIKDFFNIVFNKHPEKSRQVLTEYRRNKDMYLFRM